MNEQRWGKKSDRHSQLTGHTRPHCTASHLGIKVPNRLTCSLIHTMMTDSLVGSARLEVLVVVVATPTTKPDDKSVCLLPSLLSVVIIAP